MKWRTKTDALEPQSVVQLPTFNTGEIPMAKQPTLDDLSPKQLAKLIEEARTLLVERKAAKLQEIRERWQPIHSGFSRGRSFFVLRFCHGVRYVR